MCLHRPSYCLFPEADLIAIVMPNACVSFGMSRQEAQNRDQQQNYYVHDVE